MALKRSLNPMPADVAARLKQAGRHNAYAARPTCQRNDCLGWIAGAKRCETQEKRVAQMPGEMAKGGINMNMTWGGGG